MEKAMTHLAKSKPSMAEAINAPTKIEPESLNEITKPHKNLEKYDHSLETIRNWQDPNE